MRKAGAAYLVPGSLALLLVCGAGFAAGQAVSTSPASADTSVETITIVPKARTMYVPGPVTTVTAAGPKTTIIRKYSTIREKPITIPERIVHTTKIVKSTSSKTKVYVTVGKGKGKSPTSTTGPGKTDPAPKTSDTPATLAPPSTTAPAPPPRSHRSRRHPSAHQLIRMLGCGREAPPTARTSRLLHHRRAACARLLRLLAHRDRHAPPPA